MRTVAVPMEGMAQAWRDAARGLLAAGVPPGEMLWAEGTADDLFATPPVAAAGAPVNVPRAFVALADKVAWHSDPERYALLYALLWRLRSCPGLMSDRGDPAVAKLRQMEKAVRRDLHKMHAFVRFREIGAPTDTRRSFAAWFEPTHYITEPVAGFFARRFGDMDWTILTPHRSATFRSGTITFGPGGARPPLPDDATEALWTTYFRNIFNPARLKVQAMQSEMPKKYWRNLPEAAAIPDLIARAEARARAMRDAAPTLPPLRAQRILAAHPTDEKMQPPLDDRPTTLPALGDAMQRCTRCPLYRNATQAVPGEGPQDAPLMVVGEQPGDQEDLAGRPFVGPAGQLFDRVADQAGLDRSRAYVTNAVKHFKFEPRGKRRIHQRPDAGEVRHCQWWLDTEREIVRPRLIVAMGATAAAALTGTGAGITKRRGQIEAAADGTPVFLTVHPSYLLRVPDAMRAVETEAFRLDLAAAARHLTRLTSA